MMKMVVCITNNRDKPSLHQALLENGYECTIIPSIGGFLQKSNSIFIIGIAEEKLQGLIAIIQEQCTSREELVSPSPAQGGSMEMLMQSPMKVNVGGAILFVLNVDQTLKI